MKTIVISILVVFTGCAAPVLTTPDDTITVAAVDMEGSTDMGNSPDLSPVCTVRGTMCSINSVCTGEVLRCAPCGGLGQPCCEGGACSNSVCTIGEYTETCQANCGGLGQPCCAVGKIECADGAACYVFDYGPTCATTR